VSRDLTSINEVCPKCGQSYLSIKDWGEAGILFIHGYDTDEQSDLRHKLACHVPEPVARGEMSMDGWRIAKRSKGGD